MKNYKFYLLFLLRVKVNNQTTSNNKQNSNRHN